MSGGEIFAQGVLPGFEALAVTREQIAGLSDEEIDRRFPACTGGNLKASNPRLYKVAARLFFEFGLSQREVAVVCQVSRAAVAAMVRAEQSGLEAVAQRTARLRRLRGASELALARLEGMLADEKACAKAGVTGVAGALKVVQEVADKLEAELRERVVEPEAKKGAAEIEAEIGKYLEA